MARRRTIEARARGWAAPAALCAVLILAAACREGRAAAGGDALRVDVDADDPFSLGEVPDFRLTSQLGAEVTRADLAGKPFVLCAIFTTCAGPCPGISGNMRALQEELADLDVRLVSVTVDPARDTPEVLARYAARYEADPARWLFLTGAGEEVRRLVQQGFFLAVEVDPQAALGQQVTHDTRLVVVDRHGRRRGWYDGRTEEGRARARARLRHLAEEE